MKKLALSATERAVCGHQRRRDRCIIPADDAAGQAQLHPRGRRGMALSNELNTVRSAKDLFFPQVENLMGFRVSEKQIELIETRDETEPFVAVRRPRVRRAQL